MDQFTNNWKIFLTEASGSLGGVKNDFMPPDVSLTDVEKHNINYLARNSLLFFTEFLKKMYPFPATSKAHSDGLFYTIVIKCPILRKFKIIKKLGQGGFGVVYELDNAHTIKLFWNSFIPLETSEFSDPMKDLRIAKQREERLWSKRPGLSDLPVYSSGMVDITFDDHTSVIGYSEMAKIYPMNRFVEDSFYQDRVEYGIMDLKDLAIMQYKCYEFNKDYVDTKTWIAYMYACYNEHGIRTAFSTVGTKRTPTPDFARIQKIFDIVISGKQKSYIVKEVSHSLNAYKHLRGFDVNKFSLNLFNEIYRVVAEDPKNVFDIFAKNIGIIPQSPNYPVVYDY